MSREWESYTEPYQPQQLAPEVELVVLSYLEMINNDGLGTTHTRQCQIHQVGNSDQLMQFKHGHTIWINNTCKNLLRPLYIGSPMPYVV